jgi:hypothetical protein
MGVTLAGVFLVIRARYAEERRARLVALQPVTGASDDVAKEYSPISVVLASDSEDRTGLLRIGGEEEREQKSEKEEEEDRAVVGKKSKGGYMAVTGDDKEVELQEVASM